MHLPAARPSQSQTFSLFYHLRAYIELILTMVLLDSFSTIILVAAVIAVPLSDAFTIYPSVDAAAFASALNVTTACLTTL